MKDFEVIFEQVETSPEETQMRFNKAFEILFSEIVKVTDLGIPNLQNYVRAEEVSVNV